MANKLKVVYYCPINDVLECNRIALVYSPRLLLKENIPTYVPSSFGEGKYIFVNRKEPPKIPGQIEYFIYLRTIDSSIREKFRFNYVIMLDKKNQAIAFVRLNSPVDTGRLSTETVAIIFILTINTVTSYPEFDASEISFEFDLHTKNLIDKTATTKRDIIELGSSDYKPYTSNIIHLHDNDDYVMKYSGSIIKDKSFVNPFIFELNGLSVDSILKILIDDEPLLVSKDSNNIYLYDYQCNTYRYSIPFSGTYVDISKDYLITKSNNKLKITRLVNYVPTDSYELIKSINYIIDSITGETYFYKIGSNSNTYSFTLPYDEDQMTGSEVYCSSSMQSILEELANYETDYGYSVIENQYGKSLVALTDGLAIYKSGNEYTFHSYFHINDELYYTLTLNVDKISILNNKCILCRKSNKYFIYELVNTNNKFNWNRIELGITGCMYNIYLLAKQKYSNTSMVVTDLVYKGNVFGYIEDNDSLVSL